MDFSSFVRPAVRALKPYSAGTTVAQARAAYGLRDVVKLSSNENPYGPSPAAVAALGGWDPREDAHRYQDDDMHALRTACGAPYGLGAEHVLVGHGSNDVLATLFLATLAPGDEIVMGDPTFSLYPKAAPVHEAVAVRVPLREDGVHDLDAMLAAVGPRTKYVVVCDPNNPTSTRVERDAFARFAAALPAHVVVLIDQAYHEFMPPDSVEGVDVLRGRPATFVVRTLSKLGLASLRIGYAFADPELVGLVQRVRTPFNVARPAIVAGIAALGDRAFVERSAAANAEQRARVTGALRAAGLRVYDSAANFVCVRVPVDADEAYDALMRRGIVVRSGNGLGLPGHLRITLGTPEQNDVLLNAFDELCATWTASARTT